MKEQEIPRILVHQNPIYIPNCPMLQILLQSSRARKARLNKRGNVVLLHRRCQE